MFGLLSDALLYDSPGLLEALWSPVLERAWHAVRMKFGYVKTLGAVAVLGGLVQAQCPDYTTFSQVRSRFSTLDTNVLTCDTFY